MSTVIITGGTGLIGKALGQALLQKGYHVIVLTRKIPDKRDGTRDPDSNELFRISNPASKIQYAPWNIERQTIDKNAIAKADYIIHLAGAGVADKRWTGKRKQEIIDSRINSSKLIADSLKTIPNKVKAVVSASATGWYGADVLTTYPSSQDRKGKGLRKFEETDPPANDFLANTCRQWEESIEPVAASGKRLVKLRTGIVLSKEGGALKEFLKPLKFGVAAILGSGKQIISWIHIADLVEMYIWAIENENINGTYNAVAPYPVSNKELVLQLAKINKGRFFTSVHIPSFMLKLVLGEMSIEVLKSAAVSCSKIQMEGFTFRFPLLKDALDSLK